MKIQLLAILFIATQMKMSLAQTTRDYCGTSRYDTEIFSNVTVTSNISYGSNVNYAGNNINLTMDIYQPTGDNAIMRPLIIWAHGGSFVYGTKNDIDVVSLSQHFAKRGYICASINYRLGVPLPPDQLGATKAVIRAVQDMKAAVRFFRKNAATTNTYKIDPEMIFAGGSSAGAFMALHLAYLDQPSEIAAVVDTTIIGGLEGSSGSPGYSSKVNAVVNLCGAIGDTSWMRPSDIPVCSMHGTLDETVPYATALLSMFGNPIMVVNGSYSLSEQAMRTGIQSKMYTYYDAPHVPYVGDDAYMDTTVRFISNFLYSTMGCTPTNPEPLPNTFTGIAENFSLEHEIIIYPNPSTDNMIINLINPAQKKWSYSLLDFTGRTIFQNPMVSGQEAVIQRNQIASGIYLLRITMNGQETTRKICFQ